MTLQALHDYSDRETAEAVRFDVRWKAAIGASLDDPGFDPSTLVYWRKRIAKSARPHRVNDAVKKVVGQTGILTGRRRRAVDSTILADAVATQDTVTQLVSAIRRVAREVPGAAEQIAAVCTGHDYARPGKPKIDWDDPAAKDALVSVLVHDANALVDVFKDAELAEAAASALALLALVAGQDVEPAEGSDGTDGRWRIARKVAEDRVISAVDPDARHTRKSGEARRDGYRAHVAAEPETGIITDEKLTKASGEDNSDPAAAAEFLAAEHTSRDEHGQDAAGGAGPGRPAVRRRRTASSRCPGTPIRPTAPGTCGTRSGRPGTAAVIKPKPLQPAVEGGFTLDDFTVNEDDRTVTCPAGVTRAYHRPPQRHLRSRLPRLPATRSLHHLQDRTLPHPARTRRPAARGPPRLAQAAGGLHETPAQRRAGRRPGRHLPRPPAQAPLSRRNQERRLAQVPNCRTEPAQPDRQGPDPRTGAWALAT